MERSGNGNTVTIEGGTGCKEVFIDSLHRRFPHLKIITVLSDVELTFSKKAVASRVSDGLITLLQVL